MDLIQNLLLRIRNKDSIRIATGVYQGLNVKVTLGYSENYWMVGASLDTSYKCKAHDHLFWAERRFNNLVNKYNLTEE